MNQVTEFFRKLFDSSDWPPRWHCGRWTEFHGWLYIISDLLIWSAYFTIPIVIIRYISKRKDLRFARLYFLFAAFILACGATHFLDAVAFWIPAYRLSALVRLMTGVLSWVTVFYLIKLLPAAFSLRSQQELEKEIEQRKKTEEKLEASEKLFSTVFFKSPVMNTITDAATGKFIEVNENFVGFCGYTKEEVVGKSSLELNLIPDKQQRAEIVHSINEKGFVMDVQVQVQARHGKIKWVSTSAHAVNINGRDCFLTAMIDVTERKNAEQQLHEVNKELESFSYSVSHDLRAPLRIIDAYSDILITDHTNKLDEEGNKGLAIIKANVNRMGILIDDLLNLSQVVRKELIMHFTDMDKLVRSVIDEQLSYSNNNVSIKIDELESANCDSSLIRQVWINLISNAIKYSGKKEKPEIQISSERKAGEIIYSVRDNGVGFDMKYAEKLFGVFQRLHNTTEFEGTGIGLALVNRILSRHGGKIWAESEQGKGASFFFSLPA